MSIAIDIIAILLGVNAFASFGTAFFYQAKLISRLHEDSDLKYGNLGPNSTAVSFGRFIAGEIYPDLRPKWGKAISWAVLSFMALFAFAGLSIKLI